MKLSKKLRLLREEKGLTQQALADKLNIGIQSIRNYENDSMDRIPNPAQLKMLKNFYNVNYEFLLDDDCENQNSDFIDIGKLLKLSDTSINKINNLQFINGNMDPNDIESLVSDSVSPAIFNSWIETADISEFVILLNEYKTLNSIIDSLKYFSSIYSMKDYILYCLDNKISLKSFYDVLEYNLNLLADNISDSIYMSTDIFHLSLSNELEKIKKYFKQSNKKNMNDELSIIESLANSYIIEMNKKISFCLFEITELIKNDIKNGFGYKDSSLPSGYENIIKKWRREI